MLDVILEYNLKGNQLMHTTNLRKVGGSVMLAVPPALLDIMQLQPGAKVGIAIESGRLIVDPQPRRRYTLKARRYKRRSKLEREWLDSKPVGREVI
jgi:antitoxin ChpS